MAFAIIGGLAIATGRTLLLLPCLMLWLLKAEADRKISSPSRHFMIERDSADAS
ncbi:hypothetical protein [Mesorhizobium onobrychidis]|uniref:hypothetical protein n=1 Tax=Mesorhizobium onobrychidis TaxID=2775404 RepID=UPI0021573F6A|nr:hypothetical protein [Mesorhizobium onobrychidis]